MDIGERIIGAMLLDNLDRDIGDKLMDIHLRVVRDMVCPITGRVLDSRSAHLVTIEHQGQTQLAVVDPSADPELIRERLDSIGAHVVERFDPASAWRSIK